MLSLLLHGAPYQGWHNIEVHILRQSTCSHLVLCRGLDLDELHPSTAYKVPDVRTSANAKVGRHVRVQYTGICSVWYASAVRLSDDYTACSLL